MKSNYFYTMYDEILTDKEIYNYALIVDEFMRGQITYKELKEKFSNEYGIKVRADYAFPTGMTIEEHSNYIDRINSENPNYNDISYFIISGENFKNVQFRIDYKVIEILANNNIRYYMEVYKSILETQVRHSYDKSAKLKAERDAWKRRIVELQEELSIDTDELTSDVKEAVKNGDNGFTIPSVYLDENGKLKTTGPKLVKKKKD